jgi:branched-chain amino acid transport system ATP-binding protein
MSIGLDIVIAEHQRLDAILGCLSALATKPPEQVQAIDLETIDTLLSYSEDFIYAFHHPKEDRYLFPAIAQRCPDCVEAIQQLESQHHNGAKTLSNIRAMLDQSRVEPDNTDLKLMLLTALQLYIRAEQDHMQFENKHIYALARNYLQAEDWQIIDEAFTRHTDPVFGDQASEALRQRYADIVAHLPEPHGLGQPKIEQASAWAKLKTLLGL